MEPPAPLAAPPDPPAAPAVQAEPAARPGAIGRTVLWSKDTAERATAWTNQARTNHPSVDLGFRTADRDKRLAAGVLAGGVAYRFFFWILAASLLANGALGFVTRDQVEEALRAQGVNESVTVSLETAQPSDMGRWWLLGVGIWLLLWTGYLGSKALMLVHAAVWGTTPPRIRRSLRASLIFTGTVIGFAASMVAVRWLREEEATAGLVATLALIVVPFTIWMLVSRALPHRDVGWWGLVPGAILVAVGVQGLHLFTVYFLGPKLASATQLYGLVGIVSTILFWLYVVGRLVIGAATINASLYEQRVLAAADGEDPTQSEGPSAEADSPQA